jgi:flavin reductase ActVB
MPVQASSNAFREAMASFPSGATIVTTSDASGTWWGFTASSFCSVSMDPPLVLTCLANAAQCFPAFAQAERWNIHVLQHRHADLAMRFATRGAAKFDGAGFLPDADGLPILQGVSIALRCSAHSKVEGGDHLVLIGRVEETATGDEMPFVYFRRKFHSLALEEANAAGVNAAGANGTGDGAARDRGLAAVGAASHLVLGPVVVELDLGWI